MCHSKNGFTGRENSEKTAVASTTANLLSAINAADQSSH